MDNRTEPTEISRAAPSDVVDDQLVEVFDTSEESEAMVIRGLLESNGIDALVSALDAPQDVLPGVGGVIVRVRSDQAEEAMQIIAAYRAGGDTTDAEEAVSEIPPPEPQA